MLAKILVPVGEILPLVVDGVAVGTGQADVVLVGVLVHIVLQGITVVVRCGEAVAHAGSDGQMLPGHEIDSRGAIDVETLGSTVGTVAHDARVHVFRGVEVRDAVVVAVLVLQQLAALSQVFLHEIREVVGRIGRRGKRVELQGSQHGGAVVAAFRDAAGLVEFHLVVGLDFEPGLEFPGAVDHRGDTLVDVGVTGEHTVVIQIRCRDVEVAPFGTGRERQVVVVHQGVLIGIGQPVGVGLEIPVSVEVLEAVAAVLDEVLHILLGVHHLRHVVEALRSQLIGIADLAVALALAGGDHDHAVTGFSTVDGCRGTVLQHLHGLDVVRVDAGDGRGTAAVHHVQRVGRAVGRDTTHLDARGCARTGGCREHLDAGRLALEGLLRRGDRTVHDVFLFHLRDSAGDVGFFLHAVTHDDRLLEHFGIGEQFDVEGHRLLSHESLCLEADVGELDDGSGRNGNGIVTVQVCGHAVRGSLLNDTNTHERLVVIVDDRSGERHLGLCVQRPADQKGQAGERQSLKEGFSHKNCFLLGYLIDDSMFRIMVFG